LTTDILLNKTKEKKIQAELKTYFTTEWFYSAVIIIIIIIIITIIIIIFVTTLMQVFTICATCNFISQVNYVLYFHISTFQSMFAVPNMAVLL